MKYGRSRITFVCIKFILNKAWHILIEQVLTYIHLPGRVQKKSLVVHNALFVYNVIIALILCMRQLKLSVYDTVV